MLNPPAYVPILPHYTISAIPSTLTDPTSHRTLKNGLFATRPIPAGSRIIREPALITLPSPGHDPLQLFSAFQALTPHDQEQIMSLNASSPSASAFLTQIGKTIVAEAARLVVISNKPAASRTVQEQERLDTDGPELAQTALLARLAARWHAGRCSLIHGTDTDVGPETPITGLFVETARLRHSCVPNCYARYDTQTGTMTVHTFQQIDVGVELTLSAMPSVYYRTAAERAAELGEKFGIECVCEACDEAEEGFKEHEEKRKAAREMVVSLKALLTEMDKSVGPPGIEGDELYAMAEMLEGPDLEVLNEAVMVLVALIANLTETGGERNPEQIRWYNLLIDRIQPRVVAGLDDDEKLGYWSYICTQAGVAEKLALTAFGADSMEYVDAGKRRQDADRKVQDEKRRLEMVQRSREKLGLPRKATGDAKKNPDMTKTEKKEWEIVGVVEKKKKKGEEVVTDEKGAVLGTIGKYTLTKG